MHDQPSILTLTRTAEFGGEPVTLAQAKEQCRIASSDHDTELGTVITAATAAAEDYLGCQLITATYTMTLCEFPSFDKPITLPRPPVQSITSISYKDTNGDTQSFTDFALVKGSVFGHIVPSYEIDWPDTYDHPGAENVTITFVSGYGDTASDVPPAIRQSIRLMIADLFENHELSSVEKLSPNRTAEMLLNLYRIPPVS